MVVLLAVLTIVEIVILIGVLAIYLLKIKDSLKVSVGYLAKTTFGVRAIESQCRSIGPNVIKVNAQLDQVAAGLRVLSDLGEQASA